MLLVTSTHILNVYFAGAGAGKVKAAKKAAAAASVAAEKKAARQTKPAAKRTKSLTLTEQEQEQLEKLEAAGEIRTRHAKFTRTCIY